MSTQSGKRTGPRLKDMTPQDVLVLADQAKEKGLGLTPVDPDGRTPLAYLCCCPWELEVAFAQVFPHRDATVRRFNGYGGRDTFLFEEAAVRAVFEAFGLDARRLAYHLHGWRPSTYIRVLKRPRKKATA